MRTSQLFTALCAVALTACVGGSVAGRAAVPASTSGIAESGRFTIEYTANGTRQDVLLSARGAFDRLRRRYAMEVGGTVLDARRTDTPRRTISIDGVVYVDAPDLALRLGASTPWISARVDDDDVLGVQSLDPTHILETLGVRDALVE